MVVELVCVGTELLLGNIVNTNAAFLARQCAMLGLSMYHQSVVGDNEERLKETIRTALDRSDIVILCGGLGPTQDDLTKETAAAVMGFPLVEDAHSKERIEEYFKNSPFKIITDNNWKQALVPEGCIVIDNHNGTAPGIIMEKDGKSMILLPGPPNELIPMFHQDIFPYLNRLQPETIYSVMVKLCGVGESLVETEILDLIEAQENPTIATYAKTGEVHLRVTARASDEKEARKLVKPMLKELKKRFGSHIYATNEATTLEESIVALLKEKNLTLEIEENISYQGSEKSIRQLTGILMDNAIKYSSDKGSIMLTLKKKGKKVLLSVYNDAEDLPQGKLDVLFERFCRLDSSRNSGTGGSGIGLSVAKAIVQAHKGKISAENKNGNGLTVEIIL